MTTTSTSSNTPNLYPFREGGKLGIMDETGKALVPATLAVHTTWSSFRGGVTPVVSEGKHGLLAEGGTIPLPIEYERVTACSAGWIASQGGKSGLADPCGRLVTEVKYADITDASTDAVWAKGRGGHFLVSAAGKELAKITLGKNGSVESFMRGAERRDRVTSFGEAGKFSVIDDQGTMHAEGLAYEELSPFWKGHAFAKKKNGLWAVIDAKGREVVPPIYAAVGGKGPYYWVQKENGWGVANSEGTLLGAASWDEGNWKFSSNYMEREGRLPVVKEGKFGFVDLEGKLVVPTSFDEVQWFSDGLVWAKREGAWEILDRDGKVVGKASVNMRAASPFQAGNAATSVYLQGGGNAIVDRKGGQIGEKWDEAAVDGDLLVVKKGDRWGLLTMDGQLRLAPTLSSRPYFHGPLASAEEDGIKGYIGRDGRWVKRFS